MRAYKVANCVCACAWLLICTAAEERRPSRQVTKRAFGVLIICLLLPLTGIGRSLLRPPVGSAAALPTGFYEETVTAASAYRMTAFAFLADGRIPIAAKPGVMRVYRNGALLVVPLLDIHERVNQYEDPSLLGIAVDPA